MKKTKFICIVLLLSLLILVLLYSHLEFNKNDYPDSGFLFENYQMFNNTEITFEASIREINTTDQTIQAVIGDPPYFVVEIQTKTLESQFKKEDVIFVVGILTGNRSATAEKIFVREQWNGYVIALSSIPAIPFVLYLFFRTWRFNRKTVTFERRDDHA
jgi:hypothetical protein